MGQCASCGSTRQTLNSSVPNSPSFEFNTTDLFQNASELDQNHPALRLLNSRKEVQLISALHSSGKSSEADRKFSAGSLSSTFRQYRQTTRKSKSSPRRKFKTVTFSEPIVRPFEPSRKSYLPFKKIRLTSKVEKNQSTANPNSDLNTCNKLTISSFEVNGQKVGDFRESEGEGEHICGMGNSSSHNRSGSSQKFSVGNKSISSPSFRAQSLKESSFRNPSSAYSTATSEHSIVDPCLLNTPSSGTSDYELSVSSNLNILEANRKRNQLLRDRFFSSEASSASQSPDVLTPDSDMNSNYSKSPTSGLPQPGSTQLPQPGKFKRTFQYRPPSCVTSSVTPIETGNLNQLLKPCSTSAYVDRTGDPIPTPPPRNLKMNKINSVPSLGSSKIPGFKTRNSLAGQNPRNINAVNTVTPAGSKGVSVPHPHPERLTGEQPSFKKSSDIDTNMNIDKRSTQKDSDPPKCLPQRKYNTSNPNTLTKVFPAKTPNIVQRKPSAEGSISNLTKNSPREGRRYTLFTPSTKLTPETMGMKRAVESKPFYTIGLYQFKSRRPITAEFPSVLHEPGVHTGVVTQRKLFYQSKPEDKKGGIPTGTSPTPTSPQGVNRSATFVRGKNGEIRPDVEETEKRDNPMSQSTPSNSSNKVDERSRSEESREHQSGDEKEMPMKLGSQKKSSNYPLEHTSSTTSAHSVLASDGHYGDANAISDSEFLIDDEISDQPELTLTFKDSPHRLSSTSSGESLLSCDLMLDVSLSLKDSVHHGEPDVTSDSAISDISSSIPTSLGSQSVSSNSNGHTKSSALPRRMNKISSPVSSTPLTSKQNQRSNFGFRNTTGLSTQNQHVDQYKNKSPFKIQERKSISQSENRTPLNTFNKSPNHSAKSYNSRLSSTNRNSFVHSSNQSQKVNGSVQTPDEKCTSPSPGVEKPSQFVINDLSEDVLLLREQLEVLKAILVEQERIQTGKDETIERLQKEIESLKRNRRRAKSIESGQGDATEYMIDSDTKSETRRNKYECNDEEESKMVNATSQTDSAFKSRELVHPHELNGKLVSFWIGRRSYSSYNNTLTFAT